MEIVRWSVHQAVPEHLLEYARVSNTRPKYTVFGYDECELWRIYEKRWKRR